ncbi:hypothetical protein IscW_ISCW008955, partial [Ixodes scapularis]
IAGDAILKACVQIVTVNGIPLAIMSDSGFREIMDPLPKAFRNEISVNPHNISDKVIERAAKIRDAIKGEIERR